VPAPVPRSAFDAVLQSQLAAEVSRVPGVNLPFEQATASEFMDIMGMTQNTTLRRHFGSVAIDQHEGLNAGLDDVGAKIIGGPLTTVEQFINTNRQRFALAA
jgi:NAD(P)H dehydrogenase (quinone)